ncbi:MAG TPA: nucleotide exchange factor GrpE [Bacteroidales bacterium]|nr:nucleotide exchange factor GrpE [Bacteroidales bacterium]
MKKKDHEKDESILNTEEAPELMNEDTVSQEDSSEKSNGIKEDEAPTASKVEEAADKVVADVRALEEKLAEMQDKYIRLSAEFDNYRKRTLKEKMELSKYAEENILSKVIPFMDDFDRAMQHLETSDSDSMKNGINLIYMKFSEFLKQNGVKEIEATGTDFNVDLHEAVAKVQAENEKKGKVIDVVLKGYYLRDKVLRFSKVVVGE